MAKIIPALVLQPLAIAFYYNVNYPGRLATII